MTAPQMICHLSDSFRGVLGERAGGPPAPMPGLVRRTALKWIALYLPVPWPRGLRTRPAVDQEKGGTPPSEFALDLATLESALDRFGTQLEQVARRSHYLFGDLTETEWARWGYLHIDHHLRQFGL